MDLADLSGGLASFQLSVSTLLHLEKAGLLTTTAANEIIEQELLALETIQAKAAPETQSVVEGARALLERLRRARTRWGVPSFALISQLDSLI